MKKTAVVILLFISILLSLEGQVYNDGIEAFENAKQNNYPVLLVFSGSDWCQPCIRFKKKVLDDSVFVGFAMDNLVVLNADFPQRIKQTEALVKQNEKLAELYNPQGYFPHIVLLDQNQSLISTIPYTKQSASEFIFQIESLLPKTVLREYKKRIPAMGSFFEFTIVDTDKNEAQAWESIAECINEVNRIEMLISEWINTSQVSEINKNAGIKAVRVDAELYQLIKRSIQVGNLTQGAFDITFHALDGLWKFDGSQTEPADSSAIKLALNKVGYQRIQLLDSNRIYLPIKGMSIGFGGIGQGYAVDKVRDLLIKKGAENFVVNSSGDIYAFGLRADGSPWKIGIANPVKKEEIIRWFNVDGKAVVTSGNYEKYFEYKGIRYAHIINPKTGWPTQGIVSTTVINPYTEIADALATAIFVLGVDVGLDLVNQLPDTHCIIIDAKKNVYYSQELIPEN